ncbi:MAG TPA: HNH endonuclease signature motif containing protein [Gemmatimonadaceae bacterium]|nr:HNH endonuclease signature motif containing protein [Gemmatimonadaceae bacterium]
MASESFAGSLQKPRSRAAEKQHASRAKEAAWQRVRRQVLARDNYRCRACGAAEHIDVHHLKLRSAGGTSTMDNLIALDRICHSEIHAYRLFLVGGDANKSLRVERTPSP